MTRHLSRERYGSRVRYAHCAVVSLVLPFPPRIPLSLSLSRSSVGVCFSRHFVATLQKPDVAHSIFGQSYIILNLGPWHRWSQFAKLGGSVVRCDLCTHAVSHANVTARAPVVHVIIWCVFWTLACAASERFFRGTSTDNLQSALLQVEGRHTQTDRRTQTDTDSHRKTQTDPHTQKRRQTQTDTKCVEGS